MTEQSTLTVDDKSLPAALHDVAEDRWQRYVEAAAECGVTPVTHPELRRVLYRVWACSEFVAEACIHDPRMFDELLHSGDLHIACSEEEYRGKLDKALAAAADEQALGSALRLLRRREMVRLAWRDLAGWAATTEIMHELSLLADGCIEAALQRLHHWQQHELGTPLGEHSGEAQSLVVIAMGKLGARELNFSSDVDLIFAYPEDGETSAPARVSNQQYFIQLGQRLISVLSDMTAEGFVFRTDMRLRPFGESGPLAVSYDALEEYYQTHGRAWERYAMVRARVISGDPAARDQLMSILRPFVYRRYLDFTAFQELRDMKQRIMQEVARKGMEQNIKLGAGGIREIEFIVHTFQLIRGGRQADLQHLTIPGAFDRLGELGCLDEDICAVLKEDYLFLRRLENHIQAQADRQVHTLPDDDLQNMALAWSMGFAAQQALDEALERRRQRVHGHFTHIITLPQGEEVDEATAGWRLVWQEEMDDGDALTMLADRGMDDPREALHLVAHLRQSACYRGMTSRGREHLDHLMPLVLAGVVDVDRPVDTLRRLVDLIEHIGQRTVYLALLVEYPEALSQLIKLFAASPWIAEYITRHPLLLDELLDTQRLYVPLDKDKLTQALQLELAQIAADDLEGQMETLRHFKQVNVLRVAAADVSGVYPLMVVSDHLTELAEVILDAVVNMAWRHLVAKHGQPQCAAGAKTRRASFAVVGYGKLGGIELGYGSDLDLVFLHDSDGEDQHTSGPACIDNNVFFARLGQRIIHILNTFTPSGVLYEVDMRLRPSGASGLLVSSLSSFADYQHHQAWTWEHQALVRARVVAGDPGIGERFAEIRREVLSRPRDHGMLRKEVRDMRERMRKAHGQDKGARFDLKQDRGGIADIEFMVQYGVLRWSSEYPQLLQWTDNIRLLEGLAQEGLLPAADVQLLMDAYRFYRAKVHRLTLQEASAVVGPDEIKAYRAEVARLWHNLMESSQ